MSKTQMKLIISNNITVLRAEKRISQEQLAQEIDVTRATISSIENGKYNPSLELAFRIAMFFEKEITEIFRVEGKYE